MTAIILYLICRQLSGAKISVGGDIVFAEGRSNTSFEVTVPLDAALTHSPASPSITSNGKILAGANA